LLSYSVPNVTSVKASAQVFILLIYNGSESELRAFGADKGLMMLRCNVIIQEAVMGVMTVSGLSTRDHARPLTPACCGHAPKPVTSLPFPVCIQHIRFYDNSLIMRVTFKTATPVRLR